MMTWTKKSSSVWVSGAYTISRAGRKFILLVADKRGRLLGKLTQGTKKHCELTAFKHANPLAAKLALLAQQRWMKLEDFRAALAV